MYVGEYEVHTHFHTSPTSIRYSFRRKATSAGKRKDAQNILFVGATSLTCHISTSLSSGFTVARSWREISSQILILSAALSSLFVEKQ
jgi:hypothetical protein